MKVQFSPGRLRVRVARAEFDGLRAGGALALDLAAPGGWRFEVLCGHAPGLERRTGRLVLTLCSADLDALAARLPSREGLEARLDVDGQAVALAFEVDVRDGRAPLPR